jgi:hypothetical protein
MVQRAAPGAVADVEYGYGIEALTDATNEAGNEDDFSHI